MEVLIVIWLFVAICTAIIASRKGRSGFGWFLLGLIFGIFALIIVAIIGPAHQPGQSLTGQLEELERLRRRGTITTAEYDQKKARLLS